MIDAIFEAGNWPPETTQWAADAERAIMAELSKTAEYEIALLLTDNDHIQKLNAQFRGKDAPTNVLSWPAIDYQRALGQTPQPLEDIEDSLGDLAFAYQICVKESEEIGLENHFKHLMIHGILHLLGYDHIEQKDAEIMEALEISALSRLNIENPYKDFEP